jgi:hypothetical protein
MTHSLFANHGHCQQMHSFRNLQFPRRVVDMQYVEEKCGSQPAPRLPI